MTAIPNTSAWAGSSAWAGDAAQSPRRPRTADVQKHMRRLMTVANIMDSSISIPGTKVRIGLDPIIGLVPAVGDVVTTGISLFIVFEAWKIGATKKQMAAMLANVAVDFALGAVPIAGDVADCVFKANQRNLKIMGITPCGVKIEIDPMAPFKSRG